MFEFWVTHDNFLQLDIGKCPHPAGYHKSFLGAKNPDGTFLSASTAQYPSRLADKYMQCAKSLLHPATQVNPVEWDAALKQAANTPSQALVGFRSAQLKAQHQVDGGGSVSRGDWTSPHPLSKNSLQKVRAEFFKFIFLNKIPHRLLAHLEHNSEEPLLSINEINTLRYILIEEVSDKVRSPSLNSWKSVTIQPGQPFVLQLLFDLQVLTNDHDRQLVPEHLEPGVRTGFKDPVKTSGTWPPKAPDPFTMSELSIAEVNWKKAEANPESVRRLLDDELLNNFIVTWDGSLDQAKEKYPDRFAVGKLRLAQQEGRDDRLTLDTTISGVTPGCFFEEKPQCPSPRSAIDFMATKDPTCSNQFVGLSIDVSKAHKRVRLHPDEYGLMFFSFQDIIYYYVECHFGGSWSAYWWSRLASVLLRLVHELIYFEHFGAIYVDDFFFMLRKELGLQTACLIICFLVALGVPLSWKKLRLNFAIKWLGVVIDLRIRCFIIPEDKMTRVKDFLKLIAYATKLQKKDI